MNAQEKFVELKISVRLPKNVYELLRDLYALSGETVEEVFTDDCENAAIDWAIDEVRGMERCEGIIEKYGLKELVKDP